MKRANKLLLYIGIIICIAVIDFITNKGLRVQKMYLYLLTGLSGIGIYLGNN